METALGEVVVDALWSDLAVIKVEGDRVASLLEEVVAAVSAPSVKFGLDLASLSPIETALRRAQLIEYAFYRDTHSGSMGQRPR